MKLAIVILLASFVSGCGVLLPKKVEFFQDKVERVPELKSSERETQRQAAALAARRAEDTLIAAVSNDLPDVIIPAKDTALLTEAVSLSLGPPSKPWNDESPKLALKLERSVAALNERLDTFKRENNENAGKKIEGTGVFKIGYFTMWACILGGLFLIWTALKLYGMVNPVVGLGTNVVGRVSSSVLRTGLTQISKAGEEFKAYLDESDLDDKAKETVKKLFRQAHMESQDEKVQEVIKSLTK